MSVDFREVLLELEKRKADKLLAFQRDMEGIEETISGIKKMLSGNTQPAITLVPVANEPSVSIAGKYAGLGVRWAILNLLAEETTQPLPTGKIAGTLKAGGMKSEGASFTSNVSAVLSVMRNKRQEVQSTEDGHILTLNGRNAWDAIKRTPQYAARRLSDSSASALPQ